MKTKYPPEWRTQSAWKKRFYARYMKWLERIGYFVVAVVIGAFIFAFNYRVDDVISADKVQVTAAVHPVVAKQPMIVIRQLVENYSNVYEGDPILDVVYGEAAAAQYVAWAAMERSGVAHTLVQPRFETIRAAQEGVLVVDAALIGVEVEAEAEVAQIRDYNDLQLTANLSGQGVAKAKTGSVATLKSISISSASGVLLRGDANGSTVVSGRMISKEEAEKLSAELEGMSIKVRDDIPLEVDKITQLQVDADLQLESGTAPGGIRVDPSVATSFKADVISGEHKATVQFASLPPEVQKSVNQALENALKGRVVEDIGGNAKSITDLSNFNTVFQVAAKPGSGGASGTSIDGAAISRTFEAKLRIQSPPSYLSQAVRNADAEGQTVTVKVELKTGDRPIATLLLKRS